MAFNPDRLVQSIKAQDLKAPGAKQRLAEDLKRLGLQAQCPIALQIARLLSENTRGSHG